MNPFAPGLRVLRRRLRTEERGFTLVELMVAQGIILVSLLSLAYTATVGFSDIALARQRDGANGLANRLIEQVRALPFDVVKRGLSNNDATMATDPAVVGSGCGTGFTWCYRASSSGTLEAIPRGDNPVVVPINPHRATTTIGNTTYTRAVYITYYNNDPTLNAFRVTSVVSWAPPQRGGVRITVQAQSVLYSPPGCTSTATHPFASPCQPFLYANAERLQGSFTLTGAVQGTPFQSATLFTTAQSSTMQVEQIAAVQSRAVSSGVRSVRSSSTPEELVPVQASASADNDPSQPGSEYQSTNLGPTSGSCCSEASGNQNFVQVVASNGDTGTTVATTRAGGTNACQALGVSQSDALPCGRATASQGSGERITLHIQRGNAADLGLTNIAVISPAGTPTEASVDRTLPTGVDGSVTAEVRRRVGEVRLGALPSTVTTPAGWNTAIGLVRLASYSDAASASAGTGTTRPTASISAGTVQYWNPATSSYSTLNLATAPVTPTQITIPNFHFNFTVGNQAVRVEYENILFRAGGVSTSETISGSARTRAAAHVLPPLAGSFRQRIFLAGTLMADLLFTLDFLQTNATAQYVPAPGGTT